MVHGVNGPNGVNNDIRIKLNNVETQNTPINSAWKAREEIPSHSFSLSRKNSQINRVKPNSISIMGMDRPST